MGQYMDEYMRADGSRIVINRQVTMLDGSEVAGEYYALILLATDGANRVVAKDIATHGTAQAIALAWVNGQS